MKRTTKLLIAPLAAFALGVSACETSVSGINENPNAPTDVPAASILPEGILDVASLALGYNLNLDLTSLWMQHLAEIQYGEEDRYQFRSTEIDNSFRAFYSGPMMDFQRIIEKGENEDDPQPNVAGVGKVMKAYTFMVATDMWGDLPYSEALKGETEDANIQPAYDAQSAIYADLLTELEEAVGLLDANAACPFGAGDLLYGCDIAAWEKFANSLRLRLAMRLTEVDLPTAQAEAEAAIAAGTFTSNDDNAVLNYLASPPNQHPWFEAIDPSVGGRPGDFRVSATLVDTLKALNDPRLAIYANPITADTVIEPNGDTVAVTAPYYRGMPNGLEEHSYQLSQTSTIGSAIAAPDAPSIFMSYAEVLFLKAEAAERGWAVTGTAADLYEDAITAAMEMRGVASADITTYLNQAAVAYDPANWEQSIGFQSWLALFGNGPEAFATWRRLGHPVLTPGADAVAGFTGPPTRYPYPDSEFVYNVDNLNEAITRQGGASASDKVWWDAN